MGHSEEVEELEVEEGRVGVRLGRFEEEVEEEEEEEEGTTATFLIFTSLARAAVTPELAGGAGRFLRILRIEEGPAADTDEEEGRLVEAVVVEDELNPRSLARSTEEDELVVEWERGQGDRVHV